MRGGIRGWPQISFHDFSILVNNHHLAGGHGTVTYSRGFDDHKARFMVYGRNISPGKNHQTMFHQHEIGLEYFFF